MSLGPLAVAVSGGVDSMTLAVVAHGVHPDSWMFHARSPAVPAQATERVRRYARSHGWNLQLIDAEEMSSPDYRANPVNRCYFCKTHLYAAVRRHTSLPIASGTNTDDLGDYRPGLAAAREHGVVHPYLAAGISKAVVRALARSLGLEDLHTLPAAPCLSSRVTTGIAIDPHLLPVIDEAESALWACVTPWITPTAVRCRIRPSAIAIEIESEPGVDLQSGYAAEARRVVARIFERAGYPDFGGAITIEPYRRGSAFLTDTVRHG